MQLVSSEVDQLNRFFEQLRGGPAFLFIGQDHFRIGSGHDNFLTHVLKKFSNTPVLANDSYDSLLRTAASIDTEAATAWMDELSSRVSAPDWIQAITRYPWSGVFTSAIDATWLNTLRVGWRDVSPVFEERVRPSDPRNRRNLHVTFLFGCVNRSSVQERPPLTQREWLNRKQVAVGLARRLPEYVTPRGVLVLEAYAIDRDWLRPEDLAAIIDEFNPQQVHAFSGDDLADHPYFYELIADGKLVVHRMGLAEAFVVGERVGLLAGEEGAGEFGADYGIGINGRTIDIPREIRKIVSRSAIVLDQELLNPPPALSIDARYQEFRSFLGASEGSPRWSAFARGLAFHRDFEKKLRDVVRARLNSQELVDVPIILHGPTGTGKTVALAAIAFEVCRDQKYPVLFIPGSTKRPVAEHIDQFCQYVENHGARACLVVWDGMVNLEDYRDFLTRLTSRGRKVVLIGSTYLRQSDRSLIAPKQHQGKRWKQTELVEAPSSLSSDEIESFRSHLEELGLNLSELVGTLGVKTDETFLVALYRLLPETRSQIRGGVVREVSHAESVLIRRLQQIPALDLASTALAHAMARAGILNELEDIFEGSQEIDGESVSPILVLTGLVMVPGRFGLQVPLEILVRAVGANEFAKIAGLAEDIDIFRWYEDPFGNIEMGPRSSLEATLVVRSRLGGPGTEIEFAEKLLMEVRPNMGGTTSDRDIQFAVDLLRAIGAGGTEKHRFAPFFHRLALTLRRLREERGVESARLMLQEANLLREWAIDQGSDLQQNPEGRSALDQAYDAAEDVLGQAIDLASREERSKNFLAQLLVEQASLRAARSRYALESGADRRIAADQFMGARDALQDAQRLDPSNYYPLDVLGWSSIYIIGSELLDQRDAIEVRADVLNAFQTADPEDFDAVQRVKLLSRRMEVYEQLGLQDLAEEDFELLRSLGSGAGFYLRAFQLAGLSSLERSLDSRTISELRKALEFLEQNRNAIRGDPRCLDLLLDLWWTVNTGHRLFEGERQVVSLGKNEWTDLQSVIRDLENTDGSRREFALPFLDAMAQFHLKNFPEAMRIFERVRRDSEQVRGRRRVIRSYLASKPSGVPEVYYGTVVSVSRGSMAAATRGEVFVEGIRQNIPFLAHDFGGSQIEVGEALQDFHIAFNFLGPIADPAQYYSH
jgi:tetratricopeptide (TPR) repeat protein